MEGIVSILVLVCIYLLFKSRNHKKNLKKLEKDFQVMELRFKRLEKRVSPLKIRHLVQEETQKTHVPNSSQTTDNQSIREEKSTQREEISEPIIPQLKPEPQINPQEKDTEHIPSFRFEEEKIPKNVPKKKASESTKVKSEFWLQLEKQFAENWTGILGAGILVLGIGFFAIYAALLFDAVYRFAMLTGVSMALLGVFYFLKQKEYWNKLAFWIRSSAAAIFLFACLGSGGIEGLQWIDNPLHALLLLLVGVGVNLSLSLLETRQSFASLHILLSLLALGVAQSATATAQGNTTLLVVASIVTLFGIALTYRSKKWDEQVLLSISSFFAFHLFWYFHTRPESGFSTFDNIIGIITVVLVSVVAAFGHYRSVYANQKFEVLPFFAHLINWFYFGVGLSLHATGSKYKTFIIISGAIGGFILARRAKKLNITWLYRTDTLMSYFVLLFAAITLNAWEVNWFIISLIVFIETLVFTLLIIQEKERFFYQVGCVTAFLASLTLLATSFLEIPIFYNTSPDWYKIPLILLVALLVGTGAHLYDKVKINSFLDKPSFINLSFLGLWTPFTLAFIFGLTYAYTGAEYVVVVVALLLVFLRQKFQSDWLGIGMSLFLIVYHLIAWKYLYDDVPDWSLLRKFVYGLPFLLLSVSFIYFSYVKTLEKHFKFIGIYALGIQVGVLSFLILNSVSVMIIGVLSLIFSILFLEISQLVRKKYANTIQNIGSPDRYLLHLAYGFLVVFFARHLLVHLQLEMYFLFLKLRFWIEIFALLVFLYWASAKAPERKPIYKSWEFVQPLFIELSLVFIVFTVSLELEPFWHLLIWMGMAFGILGVGLKSKTYSRLRFYAILFYWATAFQVAFLMSTPVPSQNWYEQYKFSGLIAIVLQFGFLYVFYQYSKLETVTFPKSLKYFDNLSTKVGATLNVWVLYPLIFSVAAFLFFEFDKAILTLLWVIECLAIFVLSLVLRTNQFRYVALIGLGICVVRLLFFDMSQSSILTKALVFVGVGIIMVGINALYTKYKNRFDGEESEEK